MTCNQLLIINTIKETNIYYEYYILILFAVRKGK